MLKEKFHDRKISKLEGFVWKAMRAGDWVAKVVFVIQMLPTSAAVAIATFEING